MMLPINAILGQCSIVSCFQPSMMILHVRKCYQDSEVAEASAPYIEAVIDAALRRRTC